MMKERLSRIRQEIAGVVSILGGLYLALSLFTYSEWDPSPFVVTNLPARNYGGIVGSYIADTLLSVLGISSLLIPFILCFYGIRKMLGRKGHWITIAGILLFMLSVSLLSFLFGHTFNIESLSKAGGLTGLILSKLFIRFFSIAGAYIISLAFLTSSVIILSPVSLINLFFETGEKGQETAKLSEPAVVNPRNDETLQPAEDPLIIITDEQVSEERKEEVKAFHLASEDIQTSFIQSDEGKYILPDADLLRQPPLNSQRPSREEIYQNSTLLEKKLRDFGVDGKVIQVHPGPVVTMYEFEPAPGVKINRIVSLSEDLALSLKSESVRVSTLPNKAAIGIEVPNKNRETVYLREIISSEQFKGSPSKLTLALGKDIFGNPVVADLSRMPHLLVAGATGSGKSVSINSMVLSILYKAKPDEVKMLMIDPKLLELSSYENIPHLISPVITAPKEAAEALRKMVFEMERRYRLLAERGVRNIESFNRIVSDVERLPYIVIFIDELADLMFASANEVEDSIARLAQMARASGIHLILATQRPSVDVITGVIKANFPARIAFHMTSKIDSRTIIDAQGAEQLLGKGDMLLMLPGLRIIRVHGAMVTDDDVKAVIGFITSQGKPDYSIFESIEIEKREEGIINPERDEMYQRVLEFAESVGEISISSIQRRFKIGYNKAARIMELLEEDGLVGPPKGAGKPRDFLGKK
ncbi:MAG: DNA translocase FtsK [Thermodesulfovibrionales bacterium]